MPRPKALIKIIRLHVELPESTRQLLTDVQIATGAASISEVVRRSLGIYKLLVTHSAAGSEIIVRTPSGEERMVILPL